MRDTIGYFRMMAPKEETLTPLMRQYRSIKSKHEDAVLMFRLGDFYEMFERDAEIASKELDLTLTSKPVGGNVRVPLAGVPHHAVETYITRLARKGYKVAVCDQLEDPKASRGIVKRDVTRIVTPGTVTSEAALDAGSNLFLAAIFGSGKEIAVAAADLLTGELLYGVFDGPREAADALCGLSPAEILISEDAPPSVRLALSSRMPGAFLNDQPSWTFEKSWGEEHLKKHFGALDLSGLGLETGAAGTIAVGTVVAYLRETQGENLGHLKRLGRIDDSASMRLDSSTLSHLEIISSQDGEKGRSLIEVLDRTRTPMGRRLLKRRFTAPLKDGVEIRRRLDAVETLHSDPDRLSAVSSLLDRIRDLERLAGRISTRSATPRDLQALAGSLETVPGIRGLIEEVDSDLLREAAGGLDPVAEASILVRRAIRDDPPATAREGGIIRPGFDDELDELMEVSSGAREWMEGLRERERERTGIPSLKVGFNRVFGYYIEVTRPHLDKIPADYMRKQTLVNAERFITSDLKDYEARVLGAKERQTAMEAALYERILRELSSHSGSIASTASALADIDCHASLAAVALDLGYTRPVITDEDDPVIEIKGGRHPVVERMMEGEPFIPNDTVLTPDSRFHTLTGPNMAGKSTYIRQVALITLMAQAGSFVPADYSRIFPRDRIFARVGASDKLSRGLSTFMVEMVETASIMRQATERSLVILDEIGRGTATFDGVSIAWAVSEYLAGKRAFVLFATHYHELTDLARIVPGVSNHNVLVREWGDKIIFLHEIAPGASDRSYGINVASLAGMPSEVTDRAKEILRAIEAGEIGPDGRPRLAAAAGANDPVQYDLFAQGGEMNPGERDLLNRLRKVSPDSLSPREALDLLYELEGMLKR